MRLSFFFTFSPYSLLVLNNAVHESIVIITCSYRRASNIFHFLGGDFLLAYLVRIAQEKEVQQIRSVCHFEMGQSVVAYTLWK